MDFIYKINKIYNSFYNELKNNLTEKELENLKIKYLGKKGLLTSLLKNIKDYSEENRKLFGKELNDVKLKITNYIEDKISSLKTKLYKENLYEIDVTLPGIGKKIGNYHIITKTIMEIEEYFKKLGFNIINGNELDNDYYNFEALNMPDNHPSRNMHDTFYIDKNLLLRTHTSNMQIHIMEKNSPPIRFISSGKVYRRDSDITHTPMFHQIEGFFVDKCVSISNLKFVLIDFLNNFFGKKISFKMRSSYFPFTEPSMEIDIACPNCNNTGCIICKYTKWIEVLGCGMIHPKVFKNCKIDSNIYSGFAFGMGIERLLMIKHKIDDLRLCYENNFEFLRQF
ncbi:MAG TPA: phenylalanine--tRNA ligase subunit alpha [Candidatus Azoamicus sp. OHIO1]